MSGAAGAVTLTNGSIEVRVTPAVGGTITSIRHVPTGLSVLGQVPWDAIEEPIASFAARDEAEWLTRYSGGWPLLFPNGGDACEIDGIRHGFHGEASISPWALTSTQQSLRLRRRFYWVPVEMERDITLDGDVIVVEERFESRSTVAGKSPSVELRYWIKGTDDDLAARGALESAAPTDYDGLTRQDVQIEPQGHELWDGTVRYAVPSFGGLQTGESVFSFDTGGGTRHITQSRQTILRKGLPGQTAPDFKGAIGVTDTGVEGVDIVVPVYNFSETHYLPDG
ncbi:MAG TPA: hypothetical protein P5337_11160, partial [Aestuariivirga sp.]|nr:hypothetical protein [Aestuariivirga sp.]